MGYAQDLVNQGYYGYAGWSDEDARADFAATGGAGKGGSTGGTSGGATTSAEVVANSYAKFVADMQKNPPKKYEEVNPFFFDEMAARNTSEAQYAPYYDRLLSDYIARVERTKSRSQEDLQKTLDYLSASKEHFLGAERRTLDKAERQANEGYAGAGLFFSGARQRDIRELGEESQERIGQYETGYQYGTGQAMTGAQRTAEDLATEQAQTERDIGREKKYAIETGVMQRKREERDEYQIGRTTYYDDYLLGYK